MSIVGFEPTSTNTLDLKSSPLDHSGKLTNEYRKKSILLILI